MTTHTPGPWKVADGPKGVHVTGPLRYNADKHRPVAYIEDGDWHANAKLIAAAPQLLEALKDLLTERNRIEAQSSNEVAASERAHAAIEAAS